MSDNNLPQELNIVEIMKRIPHRYPFLLIDRVTSYEINKRITAYKNVTINEQFFTGHFEEFPVMPGVLIIEAMAQIGGILGVLSHAEREKNEFSFFAAIDNARFKRQVIPGDKLEFNVELSKTIRGISKFKAVATVDKTLAAEAEIMVARRKV